MNNEIPKLEDIVIPPKKKRVVARFTSKEQIISRIDKFTKKAKAHRAKQTQAYSDANTTRRNTQRTDNTSLLAVAVRQDAIGDKWGLKADRLENDVLKKLSQKLAEFQTDVIPGITDDRSVSGI